MTSEIQQIRHDDLTGYAGADVMSFSFVMDGVRYTIDASEKTREEIRQKLAIYMAVAKTQLISEAGVDPQAVREWAANNGYRLPPTGKLPAKVIAAYHRSIK